MIATRVIKINSNLLDKRKIEQAASVIKRGGIVAVPTDTVYGLAVDYLNKRSLESLYRIKKRPQDKPFGLLIADMAMLETISIEVSALAKAYIDKFWPGALTLILNNKQGQKLGLRLPNNIVARTLIKECGFPLACSSANFSGEQPCKDAGEIKEKFEGIIELVIDNGRTLMNRESSLLDLTVTPPLVLREGAIAKERLLGLF